MEFAYGRGLGQKWFSSKIVIMTNIESFLYLDGASSNLYKRQQDDKR